MYKHSLSSKQFPQTQTTRQIDPPQLTYKPFSFQDPLFQSFGNTPWQLNLNSDCCSNYTQLQGKTVYNVQNTSQIYQESFQISEKVSLLNSMLKMSKLISNHSVLLINTQNRLKTEMLIESKKINLDEDSKIICKNAQKYISFLQAIKQEQNKNKTEISIHNVFQKDIKIDLNSRIQKNLHPKVKPYKKRLSSNLNEQNPNISNSLNLALESFYDDSRNTDSEFQTVYNTKSRNQNPNSTQFTYDLQTAEKMFHQIKIVKNSQQNTIIDQPHLTPQKYQKLYLKNKDKQKTINLKSSFTSAIIHQNNTKGQKIKKQRQKIQIGKKQLINQKQKEKIETSRSRSQSINSQLNPKRSKINQKQNITQNQHTSAVNNIVSQNQNKSIALKTVDKTIQFEKMLKMASKPTQS